MAETWRVVLRSMRWNRDTKTYTRHEKVWGSGLSKAEADALLARCFGASAEVEK